MWIDIHAHLDMLEDPPEVAVQKARDQGVKKIITIGTEVPDHPLVLGFAEKFPGEVYCTLGIHPHHGSTWNDDVEKSIVTHLNNPSVVAVGEIGLDYYYLQSGKELQQEAFRRQLQLAIDYNLPVEIHTRDAEDDTIEILNEFKGRVQGVIHCFTGTWKLAEKCLDFGYNISMSGVVTFKNANDLREVCKKIPLDRLHVETDAPFLAPVPQRGKKNTPSFVIHTGQFVADLLNVPTEELAYRTTQNAFSLFKKMKN